MAKEIYSTQDLTLITFFISPKKQNTQIPDNFCDFGNLKEERTIEFSNK